MTVRLALTELYDAVCSRFRAEGYAAEMRFGWQPVAQAPEMERRVVWKPGDPDGNVGRVGSAKQPGRNPRPLATLAELSTVYLRAVDPAKPNDERAQYIATRLLFDAWFRAVQLAAPGTVAVTDVSWNEEKLERRNGAELICVVELDAMIPDRAQGTAPTDTAAEITQSLDDVDEVINAPDPAP